MENSRYNFLENIQGCSAFSKQTDLKSWYNEKEIHFTYFVNILFIYI